MPPVPCMQAPNLGLTALYCPLMALELCRCAHSKHDFWQGQGPVSGLWFGGRCTTLTYKMKCFWSTHTKTDGTGVCYVKFRPWGHVLGLVCVSMAPPSEQAEKNHENRLAWWFLQKTGHVGFLISDASQERRRVDPTGAVPGTRSAWVRWVPPPE